MRVMVLGATKGMGRSLSRLMAGRGDTLFLLGRDVDEVRRSAEDLDARAGARVVAGVACCDLERPDTFESALSAAEAALGRTDVVVVAAGLFATQERLEADPALTARLLTVNFTNTVLFCERVRERLLAAGGGTLCVFSSVAGDRGRKPVVLYGAAKAGLSSYLEGLDHRFHSQGLTVVCVKPGFVKTSMTEGLRPPPFAGDPDEVAALVLRSIDRGRPVVYAPAIWRLVLFLIKRTPRLVMRRLEI